MKQFKTILDVIIKRMFIFFSVNLIEWNQIGHVSYYKHSDLPAGELE